MAGSSKIAEKEEEIPPAQAPAQDAPPPPPPPSNPLSIQQEISARPSCHSSREDREMLDRMANNLLQQLAAVERKRKRLAEIQPPQETGAREERGQ